MGSQIDKLLEKYWNGTTTLKEEEELKAFYKKNPSLTPTGLFFRSLDKKSQVKSAKSFSRPKKHFLSGRISVAATILIGMMVGVFALKDANKQNDFEVTDPEEAYEITRTVLMKMSSSLNEGQTYSSELKKLNKAEEIIKKEKL
jgi:hypothetical protein